MYRETLKGYGHEELCVGDADSDDKFPKLKPDFLST